jgi:hypothetical protein
MQILVAIGSSSEIAADVRFPISVVWQGHGAMVKQVLGLAVVVGIILAIAIMAQEPGDITLQVAAPLVAVGVVLGLVAALKKGGKGTKPANTKTKTTENRPAAPGTPKGPVTTYRKDHTLLGVIVGMGACILALMLTQEPLGWLPLWIRIPGLRARSTIT